ncbi:hypothetical protein [Flavobacterium sp. 5]|uniref:hypothetical protein n=1 Tax=Flavobacterium sp. 5 TaxID=2035199 RepID=UPI000C2BB872|nr:hypothetical protein [Flavobacterium sp. 5]PKB18241.1 hypothetical protein CLU82_3507 [Flavobacterium sp. 5]
MKSQIAIYDTHEKAVDAIKKLSHENFSMDHVSLLGKAEVVENHIHIKSLDTIRKTPAVIGMGAGTLLGLLSGIGVFAIPGFGFLYGSGALVGIITGLNIGLVVGGLVSLLSFNGIKEEEVVKCEEHIKYGKFIVIVKGAIQEIERAKQILDTEGKHLEIIG